MSMITMLIELIRLRKKEITLVAKYVLRVPVLFYNLIYYILQIKIFCRKAALLLEEDYIKI